jgi:predicted N-acetyltransferase YhbS
MITYKVSNLSNINQYLELYKRCFKNFGKNFNYLNWLYKKNPLGDYVGIDAFHNNNLIGQIGGIPYNFKFKNNILKTLVSINICVDENYRGKKIFLNLSKKLEIHLRKKNYELLIAIGNIQATPAWIKSIQMKYLCHLDAFIGFKEFKNNTNFFIL